MLLLSTATIYALAGFLSILIHDFRQGLLLVTAATGIALFNAKQNLPHAFELSLNRIAARLVQTVVIAALIVGILAIMHPPIAITAIRYLVLGMIAVTPANLAIVIASGKLKAVSDFSAHHGIVIVRSALVACVSAITLFSIGLLAQQFSLPIPITAAEIVLVSSIAFALPLITLINDKVVFQGKHMAQKFNQAITVAALKRVIIMGVIGAVITYANYLFFFVRHNLSPMHLNTALPLYQRATATASLTLLGCLFAFVLFERANSHHSFFTNHLSNNRRLLTAFGAGLLLTGLCFSLPGLQRFFGAGALSVADWASAILAVGMYVLCRLLQRHTRRHTRRSVLKLHLENASVER